MNSRCLKALAGLLFVSYSAFVPAAQLELQPVASGELFADVFTGGVWAPASTSYTYTQGLDELNFTFHGGGALAGASYDLTTGVLVYDMSSVSFTVQSAELVLDLNIQGLNGSNYLYATAITSVPAQTLTVLPDGSLGNAVGDPLRSDITDYTSGGLAYSALDSGVAQYSVGFDSVGLSYLNVASGRLAVGLVVSLDNLADYDIQVLGAPKLIVSSVPVPAAAWLLGSALLGLGVIQRCKAA